MKIRPEGCKILVDVEDVEKTFGNTMIILPKTMLEQHQHTATIGTVIAVGPDAMCNFKAIGDEELDDEHEQTRMIRPGDKIWFAKYGGCGFEAVEKKDRGKDFRIINDEDVLAILDEE